ncbi:MAG: hypothetical protein U9N77_05565 [Thermodesulfobacteriota bacterium]|nr:hypothetical protein [Thermodesulfobacteriota bacterium]
MQKKVWITSLSKDKDQITGLLQLVKKYGLAPDGHFWVDDLKKMAWQAPLENIIAKETGLWIISGRQKDLESDSVRYGLALLCISVQNKKGTGFPIIFLCSDDTIKTANLPTPLKGCEIIDSNNKSLGAKITARANTPVKKISNEYRIDIHASQSYGIWFEFGPAKGDIWDGVLAGGLKSEINAHGVGKSGSLPLKTVLEYQMQGLKLELNNDEYSAWAVKNTIDETLSYYVKFTDIPGNILFGQMPDEDSEADFHLLNLV